jgi:hypothetical protein
VQVKQHKQNQSRLVKPCKDYLKQVISERASPQLKFDVIYTARWNLCRKLHTYIEVRKVQRRYAHIFHPFQDREQLVECYSRICCLSCIVPVVPVIHMQHQHTDVNDCQDCKANCAHDSDKHLPWRTELARVLVARTADAILSASTWEETSISRKTMPRTCYSSRARIALSRAPNSTRHAFC